MQSDYEFIRKRISSDLTEVLLRVGLLAFVFFVCVRIFDPFVNLTLWAVILAVTLYPLQQRLADRLGGRQGLSATLLAVSGLLLIGGPTVILGESFAVRAHDAYVAFQDDTISIPQPNPSIAELPLIGERLFGAWSAAASDLPGYLKGHAPQLKSFLGGVLATAAGSAGAALLFFGALIVAGIMMAYGEACSRGVLRTCNRLVDPARGAKLQALTTATIRSVATGVIGVALIQAFLLGIGSLLAGVPGAGILALIVLLLGIAQVPITIVSLPVVAYLWWAGDSSTTLNIIWTVYFLAAGMVDNFLKPLLLGRGVDAPMPVILIGALGGMVTAGIIGLFLGAVLLAVAYKLFLQWLAYGEEMNAGDGETT